MKMLTKTMLLIILLGSAFGMPGRWPKQRSVRHLEPTCGLINGKKVCVKTGVFPAYVR